MLKKQSKIIIILLISVLVLGLLYVFAFRPLLKPDEEKPTEKYDVDGDLLGPGNRPYVFPTVEKQDVEYIKVTNAQGTFTLLHDDITGEFIFEGAEMLLYDQTKISSLYVQACYMVAVQKIENTKDDLSIYGLNDDQSPIIVEVMTKDGIYNKVFIGNKLVTGGAYYVKHAEKPYIYAISSDLEETLTKSISDYITPLLAKPIEANNCGYTEYFQLKKDGEVFIECEFIPEEERNLSGAINVHRMTVPAEYIPSNDKYLQVLECFSNLAGDKVFEYGISKSDKFEEILTNYGFKKPTYEIRYTNNGEKNYIVLGNKVENSESYYAYSPVMDIIVSLPIANVPFINWKLIDYVDRNIFQRNINGIKNINISFEDKNYNFKIDGEGTDLKVIEGSNEIDTDNFRQFYITLLNMSLQGYADTTEISSEKVMSLNVESDNGNILEYNFYSLSTRRIFYTVNGKGEFYMSRDDINKIIDSAKKVVAGEAVDPGIM